MVRTLPRIVVIDDPNDQTSVRLYRKDTALFISTITLVDTGKVILLPPIAKIRFYCTLIDWEKSIKDRVLRNNNCRVLEYD